MKSKIWRSLIDLCKNESGQELIEYVLLAMMIALGVVSSQHTLANDIASAFSKVDSKLASAIGISSQGSGSGGDQGGGNQGGGNQGNRGNHGDGNQGGNQGNRGNHGSGNQGGGNGGGQG